MNMPVPIDEKTKEPLSPVYKRRIPKRTRDALDLRVREGKTWAECAERVGMAQSSLYKAINQPHVKALYIQLKDEYIQEVESLEKTHKARALEVARELLDESSSDAVRARMVEFLRGESKKGGVNVAVQVNNHAPKGYEYVRPGQQVVEIIDGSDTTSSDKSPSDSA